MIIFTYLESKVKLKELGSKSYMGLDNAAVRVLNILPFPSDGDKKGSLFGLLNRAKSSIGSGFYVAGFRSHCEISTT